MEKFIISDYEDQIKKLEVNPNNIDEIEQIMQKINQIKDKGKGHVVNNAVYFEKIES
jgi:hypothetical protein